MRVPLRWLEEFVPVDVPPEKLADLLDLSGTKVEAIHRPAGDIAGVRVAEVLEISDHPNADNLSLVEVRVDFGETHRVVCGASNFEVGDLVPLAQVGARLPELEITERKIRGEVSRGMLCSAAELGVSTDASGILILPSDASLGSDVVSLLGLDDTVFELEVTPNRPDCMSVYGVAREVAVLLGNDLAEPALEIEESPSLTSPVRVDIEDHKGCPRYLARYLDGVRVGPSPAWLISRLLSIGVRSVSNVVDVTNYVLFELGHPLHAFDAQSVRDHHIVVRRARSGEKLTTLDGKERSLHPDDLLIASKKEILALAGVMGGGDSEVGLETTNIILESAYFDPASVSFTSRRHGLRTEASARFERGADIEGVERAAARAAGLIQALGGGRLSTEVRDAYPAPFERPQINLRPSRTDRVLGTSVSPTQQASYLRALGCAVEERGEELQVLAPSFRPDLRREIDLVEEVGRLVGFERLPATLPPGKVGNLDRMQTLDRALRRSLANLGLQEAWTSSFMSHKDLEGLAVSDEGAARQVVKLANPMSEADEALRTSLLPGLLRAIALNERQRSKRTALYELARIYEPSDGPLPVEASVLAAAFCGSRHEPSWLTEEEPWSFFDAKGIVEAIFEGLGAAPPTVTPVTGMPFHPTRAAAVVHEGTTIGAIGELHPQVLAHWQIDRPVVVFEVALASLWDATPSKTKIEELSRFPSNLLDIAVVVDTSVPAGEVQDLIRDAGGEELAGTRLFDIYEGEQIGSGKKSLAFSLELRATDRTLTDAEANAVRERVVAVLAERVGATLRA